MTGRSHKNSNLPLSLRLIPETSPHLRSFVHTVCLAALVSLAGSVQAEELPTIRIGVLKFGTVHWELDVIDHHDLASREGIEIDVVNLASKSALTVALKGGAVDLIVSDWLWVSKQRATGKSYAFVPYSTAVGSVIVHPGAGIDQLSDLRGRRIGVAGGPADKSWLLLRAYARKELDADLQAVAQPLFAAPPLLDQLLLERGIDAAVTQWRNVARLESEGMRVLLPISDILPALGIDTPIPLLGWVFHDDWAAAHREQLIGFLDASCAANRILAESDAEWERIRPLVETDADTDLPTIRRLYRAGIPKSFGRAEINASTRAYAVLVREAGEELEISDTELSPNTFWRGFDFEKCGGRSSSSAPDTGL